MHAVDPHDGVVGALDQGLRGGPSTLARFETNIAAAGLTGIVVTIQKRSYEVAWQDPISLLFIDGLHDYANVARDFYHFESKVVPGGLIAFHDYADYYPGVKAFVNELLGKAGYERVMCVRSMMLLRKRASVRRREKRSARALAGTAAKATAADGDPAPVPHISVEGRPLVSCIMPTRDRRSFAAQAVECFARQDYPARELIVIDDGCVPAEHAFRRDPRARYRRLERGATIGAKRSVACEMARGEICLNWDDDDWHGPSRITRQVEALLGTDASASGLAGVFLYDPLSRRAWQDRGPEPPDGTMAYTRASWRRRPFPDSSDPGVLGRWWRRATACDGSGLYVALVHHACTAPRAVDRAAAADADAIRALIGRDRAWYDAAFPGEIPPPSSRRDETPAAPQGSPPLVSCVMPTFDRPEFVPQAVRCFLRQTYPHKELIVVDDGDRRAAWHVPMDAAIRYVGVDGRMSLGAKRNLGVELGTGDVIAHWDDDDWYAPEYLSRVISSLLQSSAVALTGMSRYLVYLLASQSLKVCSARVPAGASFCYWRRVWQQHPYRETTRAEDYFFLRDACPTIRAIADAELFAVIRHGRHTWMRDGGGDVDDRLRRLPTYSRTAAAVMGPSDAAFYQDLAAHR